MLIKDTCNNQTHLAFWGSIFSNFYKASFEYKGQTFSSSEQAFMWCKARHFGDVNSCHLILGTNSPKAAKMLGRKVVGFDNAEWDKVRYGYMVEVLKCKFEQDISLKNALLKTQNLVLIEGSPYDSVWGVGIHWQEPNCLVPSKWKGLNLLGKALMEVRDYLEINKEEK